MNAQTTQPPTPESVTDASSATKAKVVPKVSVKRSVAAAPAAPAKTGRPTKLSQLTVPSLEQSV